MLYEIIVDSPPLDFEKWLYKEYKNDVELKHIFTNFYILKTDESCYDLYLKLKNILITSKDKLPKHKKSYYSDSLFIHKLENLNNIEGWFGEKDVEWLLNELK